MAVGAWTASTTKIDSKNRHLFPVDLDWAGTIILHAAYIAVDVEGHQLRSFWAGQASLLK